MEQESVERLLSSQQAAQLIGCSASSVRRAAKRLGLARLGKSKLVVIREGDLFRLRQSIYTGPGNPNFWRHRPAPTRATEITGEVNHAD
jgi:hypothetical protein